MTRTRGPRADPQQGIAAGHPRRADDSTEIHDRDPSAWADDITIGTSAIVPPTMLRPMLNAQVPAMPSPSVGSDWGLLGGRRLGAQDGPNARTHLNTLAPLARQMNVLAIDQL